MSGADTTDVGLDTPWYSTTPTFNISGAGIGISGASLRASLYGIKAIGNNLGVVTIHDNHLCVDSNSAAECVSVSGTATDEIIESNVIRTQRDGCDIGNYVTNLIVRTNFFDKGRQALISSAFGNSIIEGNLFRHISWESIRVDAGDATISHNTVVDGNYLGSGEGDIAVKFDANAQLTYNVYEVLSNTSSGTVTGYDNYDSDSTGAAHNP